MNWKVRLRNPGFWTGIISAIVLLTQQLGLDIFPENISSIVSTLLVIGTMLGVIIDPTTDGLMDAPALVQPKNITEEIELSNTNGK